MASRRMLSKDFVSSDSFLRLQPGARLLYYQMAMWADDEGFVDNVSMLMTMTGTTKNDYQQLLDNKYILLFSSGVVVIRHWRVHNNIRRDRLNATFYLEEKQQLRLVGDRVYEYVNDCGAQPASWLPTAESSVGLSVLPAADSITNSCQTENHSMADTPEDAGQSVNLDAAYLPREAGQSVNLDAAYLPREAGQSVNLGAAYLPQDYSQDVRGLVNTLSAQYSIDKGSIDKDSIDKDSIDKDSIDKSRPDQAGAANNSTVENAADKDNKAICSFDNERRGMGNAATTAFNRFWSAYPRKVGKQSAFKAWKKIKPSEQLLEVMLSALENQQQSLQWTKDGGQFIPHPTTWLNGRRWEDDVAAALELSAQQQNNYNDSRGWFTNAKGQTVKRISGGY